MKNELANYLFHQGTNFCAYEYLGANFCCENDNSGVMFRVWSPNAKSVSVVGDFNNWQTNANVMNRITDKGVWELFIKDFKEFERYKFAITTYDNKILYKADPYAFYAEKSPNTSSRTYNLSGYSWQDKEYFENIKNKNSLKEPINIYEVNLASWKKNEDGSYYTYTQLKEELVSYVVDMGYTHVEFMPVAEYPFDGSWGYQVTGYYAITSRFGTPKEFMALIDEFHKNNIGVILDWVPAHFPKDEHGLMEFDGKPLYEYQGKDRQENANWGTRFFDLGREEVQCFLISNANFLFKIFHIDGLRVDAVASMLYLDYDRKAGEWLPNIYGNNKNLEAIAFFKKLNTEIFEKFPYALMMAEESTADVKITGRIDEGALGFNYKWNMGWMNDILSYVKVDPLFRKYDHNKLTFSLMYAFTENFVLPISHDEVVHGKCSLLNKMPGEYEDKFRGNRVFLGYMMAHPGKKLSFMGEEYGQFKEWNYGEGLEFFMTVYPLHYKLWLFYKDLNKFYKTHDSLYSIDDSWSGFEWIDADNYKNNVISFIRKGISGEKLLAVMSFNGTELNNYAIGVDSKKYKLVFSSEDKKYGGIGNTNKKIFNCTKNKNGNKPYKLTINVPKLSFMYFIEIN